MWLIIRESDNAVVGTNYNIAPPAPPSHRVVEWYGPEPPIHRPEDDVYSYDPTLENPDFSIFEEARGTFDDLEIRAGAEIAWLEATIPTIDSADLPTLRAILKRLAQQNLRSIKAWRYVFRRLD